MIQLNLEIKNVGLGAVQNVMFQVIIGANNDNNKEWTNNQIIDKNEKINKTFYFNLPLNNQHLNKNLIILVYYDDILGNKYIQKLNGNISISKCTSDGNEYYNPFVLIHSSEKPILVEDNYEYKLPDDIVEDEINNQKSFEKEEKFVKTIKNKQTIDELVSDYINNKGNIFDFVKNQLSQINFEGAGGGIDDYKDKGNDIYEVIHKDEFGVSRKEVIVIDTILEIDVNNKSVKLIERKVSKCTINIGKVKLNDFKKKLNSLK